MPTRIPTAAPTLTLVPTLAPTFTPIPTETPSVAPTPTRGTFTVIIPATALWVDTGIAVVEGQNLDIQASGNVNTWGGRKGSSSDPNGQTKSVCSDTHCPLPGGYYGELVGRIGTGAPFPVDTSYTAVASYNGTLMLSVNDWTVEDNQGEFQTTITLNAAIVAVKATAAPNANENIVIAQLNLWFHGPGCHGGFEDFINCSGRRTSPFEPALGHTYDSANQKVIQQQIDWAADYGVDAFSLEWTTPRGVGTAGSLEDNIDDAFLKAPNLNRIRWCIFYDTVLRMTQDAAVNADLSNGINFDDPKVYNAFVSDFEHFATKYFAQPQYLNIDGRPVIYIYAAWNFHGNYAGAIKEARAKVLAHGYDVFIVGDVLRADKFDRKLASQFDGNTTFTFLIAGLPGYTDVGQAAAGVDKFFQKWSKQIQGLKVAGRNDLVNFEPAWAPQFDNRLFEPDRQIYVPALNKYQVADMAQIALNNAEPVGSAKQKLIWENTWNNWAEGTTIEPTANQGPKYPAGNYQFDMLEITRDIFGAQTFGNNRP